MEPLEGRPHRVGRDAPGRADGGVSGRHVGFARPPRDGRAPLLRGDRASGGCEPRGRSIPAKSDCQSEFDRASEFPPRCRSAAFSCNPGGSRSHIGSVRVSPDSVRSARTALAAACLLACLQLAVLPAGALSIRDTRPLWFRGPGRLRLRRGRRRGRGPRARAPRGPGATRGSTPARRASTCRSRSTSISGRSTGIRRRGASGPTSDGPSSPTRPGPSATRAAKPSTTRSSSSPSATPAGAASRKPVALDGNLVEILEYSAGGVDYLLRGGAPRRPRCGGPGIFGLHHRALHRRRPAAEKPSTGSCCRPSVSRR